MDEPRELTPGEVQDNFLQCVRSMIEYWRTVPGEMTDNRVSGIAFSILAMLDGENAGLPAFIVAPDPASGDKAFRKARGINWYPENRDAQVRGDISGDLHERLQMRK